MDKNPRKKKFRKKNQLSRATSQSAKLIRKNKKNSRIYENPIIFTSNQPNKTEEENKEEEENGEEEENIINQENDENENQIIENNNDQSEDEDNKEDEENNNKEDINEEDDNNGEEKEQELDGPSRDYLQKKRKYEESKKQYFDDINNKSSKYKVFDNGKIELKKDVTNKGIIKKFKKLQKMKEMDEKSSVMNARAEILLPQETGFIKSNKKKTFEITQKELKNAVDMNSARKSFEINLDTFGPYKIDYTSNGNYMAIAGNKGHLAQFNWKTKKLSFELHLNQTVRDVKFLHNQSWLAVAQKDTVNIYDERGMELHCLDQLNNIQHLEFIKLAWLLVSLSETMMYYKDVSTGKTVSYTRLKNIQVPRCLATNEWNGISLVGDSRGSITMWGPSYKEYLVKILVSKGPIEGIQVDKTGNYFIASSMDRTVKVYDVRMFKELHSYSTGTSYASHIALSQKNVFAMSTKDSVRIYKDIFNEAPEDPYLCYKRPNAQIVDLNFVPYEDVLGIGHSKGISSILVPGSGEPNFDTFVDNPFMKTKQLREHVVNSLLTKIQPELIQLEPDFIGKYEEVDQQKLWEQNVEFREKTLKEWTPKGRKKTRMDPTSVNRRKQKGMWDQKRELIKDIRDRDMNDDKVKNLNQEKLKANKQKFGAALGRFQK